MHCLDKDRKDIPNFQIFFRLSSTGRDLRAVRRLRACEGRRRSRRPAPPDALRRTVGLRRTGERVQPHRGETERVVPHRRATDEGKRPSARGGGHHKNDLHTGKRRPMPGHAGRKRRPEPGNGGRRLRTKSGPRPSGVRRDKGAKRRRGEGSKGQRVEKKPLPPRFAARPQAIFFFAIR